MRPEEIEQKAVVRLTIEQLREQVEKWNGREAQP